MDSKVSTDVKTDQNVNQQNSIDDLEKIRLEQIMKKNKVINKEMKENIHNYLI